jgi:hypothetical protein
MKLLLNTVQMALTLEEMLTATSLAYDTIGLAGLYALVVKGLAGMLGNLEDANFGWSRWLVHARMKESKGSIRQNYLVDMATFKQSKPLLGGTN